MKPYWPGVESCGDQVLLLNQACLKVESSLEIAQEIAFLSSECYNCPFRSLGKVPANSSALFVVNTSFPVTYKANKNCNGTKWLDDFGLYTWRIGENYCGAIKTEETPERFWANVVALVATAVIVTIIYSLIKFVRRNWRRLFSTWGYGSVQEDSQESLQAQEEPLQSPERAQRLPSRIASIDVFRGLTMTLMIFVNYGGGQYSIFKHAPWNGLHIADVVFPFFIWIMGMCTVISLRSHLRASFSRWGILIKILGRSLTLISIGIVLNSGKGHGSLRLPGVLQRIGITYFIVATTELFFSKPQRNLQYGPWTVCSEIVDAPFQWIVSIGFLAIHVCLTFLLPVPGCPTGYLGPGGIADNSLHENCTGGAAGYIDRLIFTPKHIYQNPTSSAVYLSSVPFDPEGLLGLFTSVYLAFLGAHSGRIILSYQRAKYRIMSWLSSAALLGVAAGILCSWSKEDGIIPVNKNLWSVSYVLATSSMAFVLLSLLYWIIDVSQIYDGRPFNYAGMNALFIYIGHELMKKQLPWRWSPFTGTHMEHLVMDLTATLIWLFIAFILFKRNIFITI